MIRNRAGHWFPFLVLVVGLIAQSESARACAVCFGDPDAAVSKGVVAGVWVLLGIVSFVLAGVGGLSLFWVHRSRMLVGSPPADGPLD